MKEEYGLEGYIVPPIKNIDEILGNVFKTVYTSRDDQSKIRLYENTWEDYIFYRMAHILENFGWDKIGYGFIQERMITYGVGLLEEQFKENIEQAKNRLDERMERFNEYEIQKYRMRYEIKIETGEHREINQIWIDKQVVARIKKLSKTLRLKDQSLIRCSIYLSAIYLKEFLPIELIEKMENYVREFNWFLR